MKQRVITGILMFIILVPMVIVPAELKVFEMVVVLFSILAMIELINMFSKEKKIGIKMTIFSIVLMLLLQVSVNYAASTSLGITSVVTEVVNKLKLSSAVQPLTVLLFMLITLMSMLVFKSDYTISDLGKLYSAIIYIALCTGAFNVLRFLGVRFVVYLLVVTISTDIFALVFGMLLGKHKMAPLVSPKKTWEGAIGGTLVATILGTLVVIFYPFVAKLFGQNSIEFYSNVFDFEKLGKVGLVIFVIFSTAALSVASQIGDLVASKLKRNFGIKDYSNLFPGHGGVLDRFDSAFFASAIFLLFIFVISYILPVVA